MTLDQGPKECGRIDQRDVTGVAEAKWGERSGGSRRGVPRCGLLQLDRGLPLVGNAVPQSENRRNGVEQPAHTAGVHRRGLLRQPRHVGPLALVAGPHLDMIWYITFICALKMSDSHPPRLADRRGAAGERHRDQMPDSFIPVKVGDQALAAPQRCVGSVPVTVECEPDNSTFDPVFGQTRGDVGVMMLYTEDGSVLVLRPLRREVLRVQIMD